MKIFTIEEVQKHNTKEDCYIIIDQYVYNMSNFNHPGGKIIFDYAGKNATVIRQLHNKKILKKFKKMIVGTIQQSKL